MSETQDFLDDMMPRLKAAEDAIHSGDPQPRYEIWSHEDPVSLLGAFLSGEGWDEVSAVFRHIAGQFSDLTSAEFELLTAYASGDLAYTIGLEHTHVRIDGEDKTYTLRATQIYRRDNGVWKVVHRHGDNTPYLKAADV